MALSIQNNPMAAYANRQASLTQMRLQVSLMRMASGFRINSAADDAAGLAISEKLRAQQTAYERAMSNAQDGNSLVQTAEGALSSVHSMLNRLTDLSMQAANGTLNDSQRAGINNEAQTLMQEINRVSQATNFNGINLLDGSLMSEDNLSITGVSASRVADSVLVDKTSFTAFTGGNAAAATFSVNGEKFALVDSANYNSLSAQLGADVTAISVQNGGQSASDLEAISQVVNSKTGMDFSAVVGGIAMEVGEGLNLQVGDTPANFNKVNVSIPNMSSSGLGLGSIDLSTQAGASRALGSIRSAIDKVSTVRGSLGATQNRLEHTINNLGVSYENITASESRIRDADMAKEMMNFTKYSLLRQTSNAMMSQGMMSQQMILQMLR